MKKSLLLIFLIVLAFPAVVTASNGYIDEMGEVLEEISLLNLLRGIYLTEAQARKISELAIEAEKLRQLALTEVAEINALPLMRQLREELFTALAEEPPVVRHEVEDLDMDAHEVTGKMLHQLARFEDEIRALLSPGQRNIFWDFVPCVKPEYSLENPVRTGQAAAGSRLMPVVELIRETPDDMWKRHGQAYIDQVLKIQEQEVGKLTDDSREDLRRRLVKQAWKIRRMNEPDFLINRESLAEELLLVNREHTMRSGHRITGKIARFFLSPVAARIMPRWVETHFDKKSPDSGSAVKPAEEALPVAPAELTSEEEPDQVLIIDDKDAHFWQVLVPESLDMLPEPPYFDHFVTAFGRPYSKAIHEENDKYVDAYQLMTEASVILTREGDLKYYKLIQGEP